MNKCLSWKINDDNYAYLYIPNKKNHISSRITDSVIINKMIERVNIWNEDKYRQSFSEMNEEVYTTFGVKIPYSDKYFGDIQNTNVFVLGTSKEEKDKFEEIRNELLDIIDEKFSTILNEVREANKTTIELLNKRTIDSAKASRETLKEALDNLELVKKDVEKKFTSATKTLNKAAKVLELDNLEINADSLKDLFLVANSSDKWISSFSGDIQTIRTDYNEYKSKLPFVEKEKNVFNIVREKIDKLDSEIKDVSLKNDTVRENIKKIQLEQKELKDKQRNVSTGELVMSTGVPIRQNEITRGDFKFVVGDDKIIMENKKINASVIIDNEGIKLDGKVFINGKEI